MVIIAMKLFENITDTRLQPEQFLHLMQKLKTELIEQNDPHAFFVNAHIHTTECLLDFVAAIEDESHPNHRRYARMDKAIVRNLNVYFGERYLDAYLAWSQNTGRVPLPWMLVFEKSNQGNDAGAAMLLGAIAHISYDMPFVLATRLPNGEILFDSNSERAVATYLEIDKLIANQLPDMIRTTRQIQLQFNSVPSQRSQRFRYGLVYNRLSANLTHWFMFVMIRLTRQEARWLQKRLLRNEYSNARIEKIVCNRLRLLSHNGSVISFLVFLSYGLIARQFNRPYLATRY